MTSVPAALEAAIRNDLHPVRPLPPPARRAAMAAPLAILTLVAATVVFGLRGDAPQLGWVLTWGTSAAQTILALGLVALALREAVPGRGMRPAALPLVAAAVLGFLAAVTVRTWSVSPTVIEQLSPLVVLGICFTGTFVSAVPLLVMAALLAARAFVVRPWSAGLLYGLGAGLGADAGWRLFCHFSDPAHVFPAHTAAVAATGVLGIAVARWIGAPGVSGVGRSRS